MAKKHPNVISEGKDSVPRELDLTHSPSRGNIPPAQENGSVLCMKGGIYTKEKCPICRQKFERGENDLFCFNHQTRPKKYFIKLYTKELKKNVCLYSDSRGNSFSSYEQANRILTKIRAEIDAGSFDISRYVPLKLKPLQFNNWSAKWLHNKEVEKEKKLISPSFLKELRRFVRMFQDYFKDEDIRDIGTKKINDFYLTLKGSPKYILNILSCLHKMLSDALDWEEIKKMPKFPKIEVPEPDFKTIDLDTQDEAISRIPDLMDRAYISYTARQMVRPSETRALFWDDLDFKHDRTTIRRHFSLNELRETTKSRRIKVLPLDGEVKELLLRLPRHITSPFVFQKKGRPYSESYARKLWNRIIAEMGIKISFYRRTRHSSATEAVNRVGMDRVQEFLGHTRSTMTRRYAKMNAEGLRPVLRK
jgi:integrase